MCLPACAAAGLQREAEDGHLSAVAAFTSTMVDPPESSNLSSDMGSRWNPLPRVPVQLLIVNVAVNQRVFGRMRATFSVFFDSW